MGGRRRIPRSNIPWYTEFRYRIRFLRACRVEDSRSEIVDPPEFVGGFTVALNIHPQGCPVRRVTISFRPGDHSVPWVLVDGPEDSPHRYPGGYLCMWYPGDPDSARWRPVDGPEQLLGHIAAHLVKEEWYRLTEKWPGDEVGH